MSGLDNHLTSVEFFLVLLFDCGLRIRAVDILHEGKRSVWGIYSHRWSAILIQVCTEWAEHTLFVALQVNVASHDAAVLTKVILQKLIRRESRVQVADEHRRSVLDTFRNDSLESLFAISGVFSTPNAVRAQLLCLMLAGSTEVKNGC